MKLIGMAFAVPDTLWGIDAVEGSHPPHHREAALAAVAIHKQHQQLNPGLLPASLRSPSQ